MKRPFINSVRSTFHIQRCFDGVIVAAVKAVWRNVLRRWPAIALIHKPKGGTMFKRHRTSLAMMAASVLGLFGSAPTPVQAPAATKRKASLRQADVDALAKAEAKRQRKAGKLARTMQ